MLKVFIGSSSESYQNVVVRFMTKLRDQAKQRNVALTIVPWRDNSLFRANNYTLESLQQALGDSDAGIFFFSKDDQRNLRGTADFVPRDNVVFEAGMFTAELGRYRTHMLVEEGATPPSDLKGLTHLTYSVVDQDKLSSDIDLMIDQLLETYRCLVPVRSGERWKGMESIALSDTIKKAKLAISNIESSLLNVPADGFLNDAVFFGTDACLDAYVEALSRVQRRFWTTTFFSSGFFGGRVRGKFSRPTVTY